MSETTIEERKAITLKMKARRQGSKILRQVFAHTLLILGAIIFAFPFAWVISTSLKVDTQLFTFPPILIPNPVKWANYPKMLSYLPFFRFMANTFYVTVMVIIGTLLTCPLVAYSFARLRYPGRDVLFIVLLSTMMLPFQVTMIPLFLMYKHVGWIDTFKPLWVPSFFPSVSGFYIFLLRQFFRTIPYDLEDAAKIDGCSYFQIYWRIMLPLVKPAVAVVAVFAFMGTWNSFVPPLIFLNSTNKLTMALGLRLFQQEWEAEWAMMMAATTLMIVPILLLFFFAQRYFIEGIVLTGMKG